MAEAPVMLRRRQYCGRCGQVMFEFFFSPDGHFGLVSEMRRSAEPNEIRCPTCDAPYRLLDRLDSMGRPVARK